MKRYGCLLMLAALAFPVGAMAATGHIADDSSITGASHNFKTTDGSTADEFEGPGLVHCTVGKGCEVTTVDKGDPCAGKPILVHCPVGGKCSNTCDGVSTNNAMHMNRKAASVHTNAVTGAPAAQTPTQTGN